ncbi:hypothetical protein GDO86_015045 [Hymenochirus boettgeri]|uniref:Uncharacterized protein n=1 Tax=Hymenochirus boettgeri TaxID=247094 RepID=A0A8T2JZN2_9PIPI|nr:hypothetical protein GDO86_015045 [Hymenochirus boettgeri]KAG8447786.1 hypothetical protein GDO86_015045 [Hymenochirus boettgeri]
MTCRSLISIILLMTLCLWCGHSDPDPGVIERGRTQLQMLQDFAQHPRYGDCWRQALQRVDVGCKRLNDEEQSRIALAFTHCHLERSGRDFPACSEQSTIRQCTRGMDSVAFNTYTEFFTHAHSICYYLQNEIWQDQARDIIMRLTINSDSVAQQLEATNSMAHEMMQVQNVTLRSQEEILRNGHILKESLQESTMGVKQVFLEMQQSASEQRLLFSEIFNRVTYLHQFVVGESNSLYSFLYNIMACAAVFLLTSTRRTAGARLILFGLVAANIYVERMICSYILGGSDSSFEQTENITFWVGMSRKISTSIGLSILLFFMLTHRDVQKQSLEVLQGLKETKAELQTILREAEKLLNKPELRQDENQLKAEPGDSGIHIPSFIQENRVCNSFLDSFSSEQLEGQVTSTPKRRSRSPSRRVNRGRNSQASEPSVYNIPVQTTPRYNLRSSSLVNSRCDE